MRLDHVSYVASHDQISDVVNRIGSQIGTAFIDGGIHPKFGTRNFTAPLLNGQYIEVVCPMDHPATESAPFGKVVKKKSESGGGWLAWVIATSDIYKIESKVGREAVVGVRKLPNSTELKWKQLGVLANLNNPSMPFFIEWISGDHPSKSGVAVSDIKSIHISGSKKILQEWVGKAHSDMLSKIEYNLLDSNIESNAFGITKIDFIYNNKKVTIE